ncbi:MAG: type II toxin-antitoxin system HicB family antitoxin [Candidatus Methylomirabilis sp.]|nr:type II toxin-antitoxin system HicB family antitoxin [Candidatus Methylomirabilis sp.]
MWIPALKGLASWGHTKEEALRNIQDAAEAYVEDLVEAGETIPLEAGKVELIERPAVAVTV